MSMPIRTKASSGDLALIHNGIIENYASLKEELIHRGHMFQSDTDTEVLVHLIDDVQRSENVGPGRGRSTGAGQRGGRLRHRGAGPQGPERDGGRPQELALGHRHR